MNAFEQLGYKRGSSQRFTKDALESLGVMIGLEYPKDGEESMSFNAHITIIETGIAGYSVKKSGENAYTLTIYVSTE